MVETGVHEGLRLAVQEAGYYPDLVVDMLDTSLAGEPLKSYVVHHEPHFDYDEIRRHLTVLLLTPTRFIMGHTDEFPADESHTVPYATTSNEAVPLSQISSVVVSRTIASPAEYTGDTPATDVVLTVGWGAVRRVDIEPAACGDPQCEADHGYTGALTADDLTLRMSQAADGPRRVDDLLVFARTLSAATVGVR